MRVLMPNDATWLEEFDERTQQCIDAREEVALEDSPRIWPISGDATAWNPEGHPLSKPSRVEPFPSNNLTDERTGELK
jgi:hypothetical protein